MSTKTLTIGGREVGPGRPVYIVAEMSGNHGHDFGRARALVEAAAEVGADAIKLQTYTPDTLTIDSDAPYFLIEGTLWHGRTLHDLYGEAYTPWDWHGPLKEVAEAAGLDFFSTPFDDTAVDFLVDLGVPVMKLASFENGHLPLIRRLASTGLPLIMSTGMASLGDLELSVKTFREAGGTDLALLKCTSAYPAPLEEMNLRTIPHLANTFGTPVGLSDHTMSTEVAVAAVALGACAIEKHFILDRGEGGPDAGFSLEPHQFADMVKAVRSVESAMGIVSYVPGAREATSLVFRRSLFIVEDVPHGEVLTEENVRVIRPGHGLNPRHLDDVLGRRVLRDLRRGTPLSWEILGERP